jgi:hypothetical protein
MSSRHLTAITAPGLSKTAHVHPPQHTLVLRLQPGEPTNERNSSTIAAVRYGFHIWCKLNLTRQEEADEMDHRYERVSKAVGFSSALALGFRAFDLLALLRFIAMVFSSIAKMPLNR